jgi:acyl dehydratase
VKIVPQHFEEYTIGDARTTLGRTITEADVVLHAGQTGDFYPHHMDAEWVKTQPFGQRVAHGTLILSVAVGMTAGDINPLAFSYGYDRIRFVRPVHIGDTITVTATIAAKRDDPKRSAHGFVDEEVAVSNQQNDVILVLTHVYLVERAEVPAAADS